MSTVSLSLSLSSVSKVSVGGGDFRGRSYTGVTVRTTLGVDPRVGRVDGVGRQVGGDGEDSEVTSDGSGSRNVDSKVRRVSVGGRVGSGGRDSESSEVARGRDSRSTSCSTQTYSPSLRSVHSSRPSVRNESGTRRGNVEDRPGFLWGRRVSGWSPGRLWFSRPLPGSSPSVSVERRGGGRRERDGSFTREHGPSRSKESRYVRDYDVGWGLHRGGGRSGRRGRWGYRSPEGTSELSVARSPCKKRGYSLRWVEGRPRHPS